MRLPVCLKTMPVGKTTAGRGIENPEFETVNSGDAAYIQAFGAKQAHRAVNHDAPVWYREDPTMTKMGLPAGDTTASQSGLSSKG
jgi:hypothetical protein